MQPDVQQAIHVARSVRRTLLLAGAPLNLAGQCGLASMLVVASLEDPHALRTGFFMHRETFLGRRGRYPNRHAWCRIGPTIVDATASQFSRRLCAVHVARFDADHRYVETASGAKALDDIMDNWCGNDSPPYVLIAADLRKKLRRRSK